MLSSFSSVQIQNSKQGFDDRLVSKSRQLFINRQIGCGVLTFA